MTTTPSWPEYLRRITNDAPGADISRTTGIPASTISRWLSGETKPSWEKIDVLAKHYDFEVQEALEVVAAFTPLRAAYQSTRKPVIRMPRNLVADADRGAILTSFSDLELAEEFVRRIEEHASVESPQPLPYADDITNVYRLRRDVRGSIDDELDAVARPRDPEPTDEQ